MSRDPFRPLLDLRLPDELGAWRHEVRNFLVAEMEPSGVAAQLDPTELTGLASGFERAHHRRAAERGFLGISMPVDVGGGGRSPRWKAVYDYEAAYHDAPSIDTGVTLCGHALASYGTGAVRSDLCDMVAGRMTSCIAYTEEEAGSDLGALQTTGRAIDGSWVIDGRKALVTGGHRADVCLTIVRTDPDAPTRAALTMFLVPMTAPGITVTRRPTINGWTLEDIEFDSVIVDDSRVVGNVGNGWHQLLGALGAERAGFAYLGWATRRVEELLTVHGDDRRVVDLVVALGRSRRFCERVVERLERDEPLGHTASAAKLSVTELLQGVADLGAEVGSGAGAERTALFGPGNRFAYERIERLHCTIGGGTSEIQRDTIARIGMGLR